MYKIIGADGNEYGPVTSEQVRQWIAEGRANGQTKVQAAGSPDWQTLGSVAEFADALLPKPATMVGTTATAPPPSVAAAAEQLSGPAIGLIVTAVFGFLACITGIVVHLVSGQFQQLPSGMDPQVDRLIQTMVGALSIISCVFGMVLSFVILYGALQMKKVRGYGWAMASSIVALVPFVSPCCLLGLPIGIWALVVLLKPEVKAAFKQPA
jgi:hypothetical protein